MKQNNELADLPVEVVYKYLLRDYRALQQENKDLKKEVRRLIEMRFDEISPDDEKEIVRLMEKYKLWGRQRFVIEIERLTKELSKYTP